MSNHLTIGVYPDKSYVYNVVKDDDLQNHIEYNKTFRPGRLLYVDGKLECGGVISEEHLGEYNDFVQGLLKDRLNNIDMLYATIPYR